MILRMTMRRTAISLSLAALLAACAAQDTRPKPSFQMADFECRTDPSMRMGQPYGYGPYTYGPYGSRSQDPRLSHPGHPDPRMRSWNAHQLAEAQITHTKMVKAYERCMKRRGFDVRRGW